MASSIQLLRSTNPQERPFAGNLLEGQPAANLHSSEPGLFFKTTDGSIVKFGPAAITSDGSPPNSTPQGSSGNSVGELWLDKSFNPPVLRVYDGSQWVDAGSGGGGGGGGAGSFLRWIYVASGGETSLSGTSGGVLLLYTAGLEEVFINGVLITRGTDYSAINGTSITNLVPLTAGDVVTVLSMNPLETVQLPGQVSLLRWTILATAGQTVLSGIDSSAQQLAYTAGFEEVYVNGAFLRRGVDYTATDGSTVTISSPLSEDDEVTVMAWSVFEVGDILVRNENVAPDANIAYSKLDLTNSITDSDVAPDANIAYSKLDLTNSITDSDISASADIASDKLIFSQPGGTYDVVSGGAPRPLPGPGTTTSVQDRLGEHISAMDFIPESERAAIRDGSSTYDATADLQAAINACQSNALPLYIPCGKYNVTSLITARAINMFGDSSQGFRGPDPNANFVENRQSMTTNIGSWLNGTDPTVDVLRVQSTFQKAEGWVCENLIITGGRYGIITLHITAPSRLDNLDISGQTEACIRAGSNAFGWTISNCRFGGGRFGVVFAGTGRYNWLQLDMPDSNISGQLSSLYNNWYINHSQAAVYLKASEGVSIIGGYFELLGGGTTVGWQPNTSYDVGDYVIRDDQECMRCLTAGTSGSAQPTTTKYAPYDGSGRAGMSINPTETDGTVVWEILGQSAAVLVQDNRGFRLSHTQGERNYRVSCVCLLGRATHSYAAIISNNNFRQHFPAPGVKAVPDPITGDAAERVIIEGNYFSDTLSYYRVGAGGTARGWIISNNFYQNGGNLEAGAQLLSTNILNNIGQPGNTQIGYYYTFPKNEINNAIGISTPQNTLPLAVNRSGGGVIFSGGTSSDGSSEISKIQIKAATATTTDSTIFTLDGEGANLVTVTGSFDDGGTLRRFSDLLFFTWGISPTVISSNGTNSPSNRNYGVASNNQLRLKMDSGSYSVRISAFGTNFES